MDPIPGGESYTIASPVAVYKNLAIFPGRTGEHNRWGIPGDLRGFDLLTGKEVWRFHTIPHPGDPNFGTWGMNGWQDRKGPGSWQPLTVDNENGLVFVALGNAVDQNYGNSRPGSNLYSASVVALDAATGKYKWHFQTAHHDIYDGDLNAPPMFAEVNQERPAHPGDRAGDEDGPAVLPEPADRRADLRRRGAAGAAERRAGRRRVADAAVPAQAGADHAPVDDAQGGLEDFA